LPASEVVELLDLLFEVVVASVGEHGGWVNRFLGDAALCVFGAPRPCPDHADRAVRAGMLLSERILKLSLEHEGIDAGIGICTGQVVLGNVGSEDRHEYTVIGDPVNIAARLSSEAKNRPGRILAAADTIRAAWDERSGWERLGSVILRGRSRPTDVWQPAGAVVLIGDTEACA
jgi:adenylate cyclase